MTTIQLKHVEVFFKDLKHPVLTIPHLTLSPQTKLAIRGESGSGKTTLINILCGLEKVTQGHIYWDDTELTKLSEGQKDAFRAAHVGLIMQDFHLYAGLDALQNVLLPSKFCYWRLPPKLTQRAKELLDYLGVNLKHPIDKLSRGEKQRVAIARALVNNPSVIIADEPTASLDKENSLQVTDLLIKLSHEINSSLICVTHDPLLAEQLTSQLILRKGQMIEEQIV